MRKTVVILAILGLVAAAGAFADLGLGLNGALYMTEETLDGSSPGSIAERFRDGEGVYYGLMAEFLGKNIGLNGNYMASSYESSFWGELVNMDLNLALEGHLFGSRRILDPIIGVGLGYIFTDYANEEEDPDEDNPLFAMRYWFLDAGLGVNLGPVGLFTKFYYHFKMGAGEMKGDFEGFDQPEYDLAPYKILIGAKVMFPLIPRK